MKHPPFWLVAPLGMLLASIIAVAAFVDVGRSPVYSAAAVQAGLARNPEAWVGRTVRVRGTAVAAGCFMATESALALCSPPRLWLDDADPGAREHGTEITRNRSEARIVTCRRPAINADAHVYSTSVPFTAFRLVARGRMPSAPRRLKCSVA